MINYSWITTQPISPASSSITSSASCDICQSASVYFQSSYSPFKFAFSQIHVYTCRIGRAALCVQVSALSGETQQLPTEYSMIMLQVSWDFAKLTLCRYYSPCCSPSSLFLSLCVTVCLCLLSYTSHCIWPCWLSRILHFVSAALESCLLRNCWWEKKEALELPQVLLNSRWHIKWLAMWMRSLTEPVNESILNTSVSILLHMTAVTYKWN